MRLVTAVAAAVLAISTPAGAQDWAEADVDALIARLDADLPALAASIGQPPPPSLDPLFRPLFEAVDRPKPDDPPEGSLILGFNFAVRPEGSAGLLADEAACQATRPGAAVIRFRRFERAGALGHDCVVSGPGEGEEAGVWVLLSEVVLDGPEGRLGVRFGAVSAVDADTAAARRMIDLRQPEILDLAEAISEAGVAIFLREPLVQ